MIVNIFRYIASLPDNRVARAFRNIFETLYPKAVAVTQATSRTTGVSVTSLSGAITTNTASLAAETSASFTTRHPDFAVLAARIAVSNLHKNTKKSFS